VSVQLYFRGEKMAKVMGSLAMQKPVEGMPVSGILVKRNFNYHILAPADLPKYTDLTMSTVTQVSELVSLANSWQLSGRISGKCRQKIRPRICPDARFFWPYKKVRWSDTFKK
jgi:hypothetical protein